METDGAADYDAPVIIVGAGPVGMLLAYQLDRLGIGCLIADKNLQTTQWPKMDLTNCRSMEILRFLGLADDYRAQHGAVSVDAHFDSIFITSLKSGGHLVGSWRLPSVQQQRNDIKLNNDGSQPAEPGQRCSQIIFEAWLKNLILSKTKVIRKFGWTYLGHVENAEGIIATFSDNTGQSRTLRGRFLVGCDGGSSRVRRSAGIKMSGGQIPARFYLIHFRSAQLARELSFGRFWHAFTAGTGFLIDQDEKDTFTAHYPLTDDEKDGFLDPHEVIHKVLGGSKGKWPILIDEVLVHSEWQPSFSLAEDYSSKNGRVLLAGDAAHRNPPHGGYGMNSGLVDAIDLGWRLAAVTKGYGGERLLKAYGTERRPMMIRALQRSYRHVMEHVVLGDFYNRHWNTLNCNTPDGDRVRTEIESYITLSGPETLDRGIELDLRYDHSPFIYPDGTLPVPWSVKTYKPSTRPGSRAPHVFLKDGVTSTYDLFGKEWTLMQFDPKGDGVKLGIFLAVAEQLGFPLKHVVLRGESHVQRIWERDLVLVRPDTHVAWRGNEAPADQDEAKKILLVVAGKMSFPEYTEPERDEEYEFRDTVAGFAVNNENDQPAIVGEDVD
ncbi:uncharacterized protein N7482_001454 [Penicillium canariense]|uniref:FAD-binding domain-containing protein n=1 Tax=Penicillium canariense TaxID=189055 RepID=A0A9W9LU64_9EURO|nr:uncharacterized protein N7482_001454 [Penicillium canariense]KAJ5175577.1 hypothetical protein N7482_001454 [Penicillium canariense]